MSTRDVQGTPTTRPTIEVAYFRYKICEWRGSLTRNRRNANLVSKKRTLSYTWAMGLFTGMRVDFHCGQGSGRAWTFWGEEPHKIEGESLS